MYGELYRNQILANVLENTSPNGIDKLEQREHWALFTEVILQYEDLIENWDIVSSLCKRTSSNFTTKLITHLPQMAQINQVLAKSYGSSIPAHIDSYSGFTYFLPTSLQKNFSSSELAKDITSTLASFNAKFGGSGGQYSHVFHTKELPEFWINAYSEPNI